MKLSYIKFVKGIYNAETFLFRFIKTINTQHTYISKFMILNHEFFKMLTFLQIFFFNEKKKLSDVAETTIFSIKFFFHFYN